jgi:acetyl-CoA synthetase
MVITADDQMRGGKALPLKAIVDEAGGEHRGARRHRLPAHGGKVAFSAPRDQWLHEVTEKAGDLRAGMGARRASAFSPLHVRLDRQAQGVQHSTGGYLVFAALTAKWTFDLKPNDVFWCTADIGWVTGHTTSATGRSRSAAPRSSSSIDVSRRRPLLADDCQAQGVDLLHRPDGDRALSRPRKAAKVHPATTCRACAAGTVGEPINPAAWEWYHKNVGGGPARSSTPGGRPRPAAT